jgi:hypothetical protein
MTKEEGMRVFGEVLRNRRLRHEAVKEAEAALATALAQYTKVMAQELIAMAAERPEDE